MTEGGDRHALDLGISIQPRWIWWLVKRFGWVEVRAVFDGQAIKPTHIGIMRGRGDPNKN